MSRIPVPVGEELLVCVTVQAGESAYCDCDPTRPKRHVLATRVVPGGGVAECELTCPRGRHPVVVRIVPAAVA